MKIAIAQMNPTIGALKYNAERALACIKRAAQDSAELVIFSELYLCGYPPKDLLLRQDFLNNIYFWALWLSKNTPIPVIIGAPFGKDPSGLVFNSALWCEAGQIEVVAQKNLLPNYNIFDEPRYFCASQQSYIKKYKNKNFLINICEDSWNNQTGHTPVIYSQDPVKNLDNNLVDFYINISASPYTRNKPIIREEIFTNIAKKYKIPVLVSGQVGGNDSLLFDGNSLVINSRGEVIMRPKPCQEDLIIYNTSLDLISSNNYYSCLDILYKNLVMGIKDYITKCHAHGLVLGLSGGIDSALCAYLAVEALGASRVKLFYLPSEFSSKESLENAQIIANLLNIKLENINIQDNINNLRTSLSNIFSQAVNNNQDLAEQNIQARLRGLILMAVANSLDYFMICTSNKSELAVGYGTLYGDMCGAIAPLGDLYKSEVYELARFCKLPEHIINRPPTAELKAGQLDTDSLPDYEILDKILYNYINLDLSAEDIFNITKININLINNIIKLSNQSEYKRRQGPLVLMVSDRAFNEARRLPIAKG